MSYIKTEVKNSRKQMGYLKIENKSSPIYEGLNVIGRDFKSVVVLKHLTSSKQHAILSIVDENTHLISDFNSLNGTRIRNMQLVPYKFYKLNDREPITFGDVVGVYYKCNELQNESINNMICTEKLSSQSIDHMAPTQMLPTEIVNIHDLSTQIYMNESEKNNENAIHDAETQKISESTQKTENESKASSESTEEYEVDEAVGKQSVKVISNEEDDHVDITSSEFYDDVLANETFRCSLEKSCSKYNIAVDETLMTENKINKCAINNEKSLDQSKNGFSDDDDDIILSTQDNAVIERKASELLSKADENDDSETDIEEEFNKNKPQDSSKTEVKSSPDKQQNCGDDSETDVEDDQLFIQKMKMNSTHSTLQMDVEDDVLRNITSTAQNDSSKIDVNKTETDICDDDEEEIDMLASREKSTGSADEIQKDNRCDIDSDDDINLLVPTQLLESENKNNINSNDVSNNDNFVVPKQLPAPKTKLKDNISQNVDEDDELPPIQLLESKIPERNQTIEDAPTQILEPKTNIVKIRNNIEDDDDLPPTQLLSTKMDENNIHNKESLTAKKSLVINDDDDLPATQLLQSKINEKNDEIEDVFLAPTQILGGNISSNHNKGVLNKNEESIFSMPTQLLEKKKSNQNKESINFSEDVYSLATQKLVQGEKEIIDDVFMAPTQPLAGFCSTKIANNSSSNEVDGVALGNNSEESIENSMKLVLSETEDNMESKNSKQPNTEKRNCESETQLEVDFALETQKLYIEEKTSRPNNPLANIFDEENTEMTDQISMKHVETSVTKNQQAEDNEKNTFKNTTRRGLRNKNITKADSAIALKQTDDHSSKTSDEKDVQTNNKNENLMNPKSANIENFRSLRVSLHDITKTKNKSVLSSDESDFEIASRPRRRNQNKDNKKVGQIANNQSNKELQIKKDIKSPANDEDNISNHSHNTRGKRISYQQLHSGKTEKKNVKLTPKNESPVKQERAEKHNMTEVKKSSLQKDLKQELSDLDDFVSTRKTRKSTKRTHSKVHTKKEEKESVLNDSDSVDSNIFLPTNKKVLKLQYTDESDSASNTSSSNQTIGRSLRTPKRSIKIEDYSSDENISNPSSTCLNTPRTKRSKYEPLNITVNSSQLLNARVKPKVVFTMLNDEKLENAVKKLGGSVVDSAKSCTVLVTNKISRSLKFLTAVTLGIPIVNSKWIQDSLKKSSFQDPWNYLLQDPDSEAKFNFKLEESLKKSAGKRLLTDYTILLATKKNFDVLKEIIETSGGKCVTRVPAKNAKAIVVSYEEDKAKYLKYLKQKSLTVVSAEAIFSGVLKQELDWNQHLLS